MNEALYEKISKPYRDNPFLAKLLKIGNYGITLFTFMAYSVLLLVLLIRDGVLSEVFLYCFLTPGISFFIVEAMRRIIPAKRPYEKLNISPLINKRKKGQSFPSRHVYSIFVIGMTFLYVFYPVAIALFVLGIAMAYIRVVCGVHFFKDVLCGAILGILFGIIGFYLI